MLYNIHPSIHSFIYLGRLISILSTYNRPLTYVESDKGGTQTLLPNVLMWGQNANEVEDNEIVEDKVTKLHRRLKNVREHTWFHWQKEYVHRLMEAHTVARKDKPQIPEIGGIV